MKKTLSIWDKIWDKINPPLYFMCGGYSPPPSLKQKSRSSKEIAEEEYKAASEKLLKTSNKRNESLPMKSKISVKICGITLLLILGAAFTLHFITAFLTDTFFSPLNTSTITMLLISGVLVYFSFVKKIIHIGVLGWLPLLLVVSILIASQH